MGKYINQNSKGESLGSSFSEKVSKLLADGATPVEKLEFQPNLVCVVDNGPFAAAGYCYDKREFEDFSYPGDIRPKQWLIYSHAEIVTK